ncbi:hypothetical protein F3J45_23030 [Pantoea sp. Ap-967]|uniref:hypothetical protein n=1 Tax=Pantoea sp. Ap-967 TaxID=2608362 RepID=UPI0014227AAD|nr:hypothetical protein [Pantoea sp. Ap-967]NIE77313.1 hypothetical protein [Pantoea sp. Ap-967]
MAVTLEFLTTDPEEIELATRYWAMNESCEFLAPLKELVPFRELTQSAQLAKFVRKIATARDHNHVCECGKLIPASARSDVKKSLRKSYRPCHECFEVMIRKKQAAEAAARAELDARLTSHIAYTKRQTIVYSQLKDDAALVLRALYDSVGPRLWNGRFTHAQCRDLTPYNPGPFINRLYEQGVLGDDPMAAHPGTYFLEDEELRLLLDEAQLFLLPDAELGCGQDVFERIMDRAFTDSETLWNLWLEYACDDVLWYLIDQCDLHNLEIELADLTKIRSTIRHGLHTHSVAQMWFIMWKVARDAAALSRRSYYSDRRATATIPGNIRKQLELSKQEGELRNDWNRQQAHIVGTLGMVFSEVFGIDEYFNGAAVLKMFERLGGPQKTSGEYPEIATAFMQDTLEMNTSMAALEAFAELIRAGLTTDDALMETIERNPELFHS